MTGCVFPLNYTQLMPRWSTFRPRFLYLFFASISSHFLLLGSCVALILEYPLSLLPFRDARRIRFFLMIRPLFVFLFLYFNNDLRTLDCVSYLRVLVLSIFIFLIFFISFHLVGVSCCLG
jgi:hypothetical protein